jgi:uncharacterized protein (TIGR00369 family)
MVRSMDRSEEMTPMPMSTAKKTYGTVSADRRREMTGLEFVQGLADGTLPLNTIAQTLGYDVTEAADGRVVITAEPGGIHLNPAGTVHGGFSATLLDSCMGLAVQSTLEKGVASTTLEFKISLVRPITPETGQIRAEGIVLNRGRRVGTAEGRITDSNGRLLAHGTTTCLIFEA